MGERRISNGAGIGSKLTEMPLLTKYETKVAVRELKTQAATLGGTLATFWAALGANVALGGALFQYGVIPRSLIGLRGILFAPFIHGSLAHLLANSVPFLVLGWLVMLRGKKFFLPVTLLSMLGAGGLAWLLGSSGSVHIGASGVIFGYLGFLMLTGWFTRSVWTILLSIGVTIAWGSVVFGVLPIQQGVSWLSHLGGFLGGAYAAKLFRK
jgi:membrane associated rhomboid family serine protease